MREILKQVTEELKGILNGRQEQTKKNLSAIAYAPGVRCFLNGKIERAVVGHGRPLKVEVSPLGLIKDLQHASREVEFVSSTGPAFPNVPDSFRALAYAAGADVPLGRSENTEIRSRRRAQAGTKRKHAA